MNMYECTVDQERRTQVHMRRVDVVCAFTRWQHLYAWNDVMAAIL